MFLRGGKNIKKYHVGCVCRNINLSPPNFYTWLKDPDQLMLHLQPIIWVMRVLNFNENLSSRLTWVLPPVRSCIRLRDIDAEAAGVARKDETMLQNPNAIKSCKIKRNTGQLSGDFKSISIYMIEQKNIYVDCFWNFKMSFVKFFFFFFFFCWWCYCCEC